MYKIAVIGDYDSIYGFATLGLSICPVKTREDARKKLKQLADGVSSPARHSNPKYQKVDEVAHRSKKR